MKPIKFTRRLSFRLALIFAMTLFLSCIGVATVVYYSLTDTIKRTELSAIEDQSLEYKFAFMKGGLQGLQDLYTFHQSQNIQKKIFFRVENAFGIIYQNDYASHNLVGIPLNPGWNLRLFDDGLTEKNFLKKIEFDLKNYILERGWTVLLQFFNFEAIHVYRISLNDNVWLSLGHSLKASEREFLKVRMLGLELLTLFIMVALILAWALSRTVIYPIRNFLRAIQEIESGQNSVRVKLSGSNDELDLLSNEFNSLMDSKAALVENMNVTLDTIAHEIRTPITRFRIGAELALSEKKNPEKLEAAVVEGLEATERISTLLSHLLDSSRTKSGLTKPTLTSFRVGEMFNELKDIYQFLLEEKSMSMCIEDPDQLMIVADRNLLLQALNNLIDNAIKYSSENGILTVSASRSQGGIEIAIKDTGYGIDESELSKIWERLYRSPRSKNENGYGIGLSIVKQVAEIHGGQAKVRSRLGQGSIFTLMIPDDISG